MKFRKLRIAWSAFWGLACVLLIVLWAHTLHRQVRVEGWISAAHFVRFTTLRHWMEVEATSYEIKYGNWYPSGTFQDNPVTPAQEKIASPVRRWRFVHVSAPGESRISLTVPFWFPISMLAAGAAVSWLPCWSRRFTLRTLLIATTLVAMVLGAIVYAIR